MSKHAPTPWRLSPNGLGVQWNEFPIAEMIYGGETSVEKEQHIGRANAEHIVHCVNHFDELVAELAGQANVLENIRGHAKHFYSEKDNEGFEFICDIINEQVPRARAVLEKVKR